MKWDGIAIDFVIGLPRSRWGCDVIWIIIDRLTNSINFLPIKQSDAIEKLAKIYIYEIMRLHDVSKYIVSDRNGRLTSRLWSKVQEILGTKFTFNTTFHPQTDGQSKTIIQTLKDLLRLCTLDF